MKERYTVAIIVVRQQQVGDPKKNSAWVDAEQVSWNSLGNVETSAQAEEVVDETFKRIGPL